MATIIHSFLYAGFFPDAFWLTIYVQKLGSAAEIILLSLGLADRINVLKLEKEKVQTAALAAQQHAADNLQQEVNLKTKALRQRTNELELAYEQLAKSDRLRSQFFANLPVPDRCLQPVWEWP